MTRPKQDFNSCDCGEGAFLLDEAKCQLKGYWDKEIETRLNLYFFMDDKKIHFRVTFHWEYIIRGKAGIPCSLKRLPLVLKRHELPNNHFKRIFVYIKQEYFK